MPHFSFSRSFNRCPIYALALTWIAAALAALGAERATTNVVVIKAGHVIDVTGGKTLDRQVIVIEGDKIKSVGSEGSLPMPSGAKVIDLGQAWVLPGLID